MASHDAACLNEYFSEESIFRVSDESDESSDDSVGIPPETPPRSANRNNVHVVSNTRRNIIKQKNNYQ